MALSRIPGYPRNLVMCGRRGRLARGGPEELARSQGGQVKGKWGVGGDPAEPLEQGAWLGGEHHVPVDGPQGVPVPRLQDQLVIGCCLDDIGRHGPRRLAGLLTVGPAVGRWESGLEIFLARASGVGVAS